MEGVGVTAGAPASQVSSPIGASTPPASALPWVEGGAESRVSDARSHACCMCGVTRVGCVCWPGSAGARLHVRTTQGGVRLKDKAGLFHLQDPNFGEGGSGGVGWPQDTPWVLAAGSRQHTSCSSPWDSYCFPGHSPCTGDSDHPRSWLIKSKQAPARPPPGGGSW